MFEQEFNTEQLTITDSNFIVSPTSTKTVRITPCREYHLMDLTPVLNLILILHIVYKWEFVAFRYLTERRLRSCLDEVIWRFSECVHHGGRDPVLPIPGPPPRSVHPHRWKSSKIKILKNNFKYKLHMHEPWLLSQIILHNQIYSLISSFSSHLSPSPAPSPPSRIHQYHCDSFSSPSPPPSPPPPQSTQKNEQRLTWSATSCRPG